MNECQEVPRGFLITGRHASVVFDLVPKSLGQVPITVAVTVVLPLRRAITQRWNHRFTTARFDDIDDRTTVVALSAMTTSNGDPSSSVSACVTSAA